MLTEREANRLSTRITLRLDTIAESTETVVSLIQEAKEGEAHTALGFASWTKYVTETFGGSLTRLQAAQRAPVAALLSEQGMSTRAIAEVTGASKSTIANDVAKVSNSGQVAKVATVGTDGKTYSRKPTQQRARRSTPVENYHHAIERLDMAARAIQQLHGARSFPDDREEIAGAHGEQVAQLENLVRELAHHLNGKLRCIGCGIPLPPSRHYQDGSRHACLTCQEAG